VSCAAVVHSLAGKWPPAAMASLLDAWLLPGEAIEGALAGTTLLRMTYMICTESLLVVLRDGVPPTIAYLVPLTDLTGWQMQDGWSGTNFHLSTTSGMIKLAQVKPRHGIAFAHAIDSATSRLSAYGVPTSIAAVGMSFESAVEHASRLLSLPEVTHAVGGDSDPAQVIGFDLARALSSTITQSMTYELWLLMSILANFVLPDSDGTRFDRANRLHSLACEAEAPDYLTVTALEATHEIRRGEWVPLLLEMAALISNAARLAPVGRTSGPREALLQESDRFAALAAQLHTTANPPSLTATTESGGSGVIDGLERLSALRAAGTLSEQEFNAVKAKLLA
jgi:hypothetical protein